VGTTARWEHVEFLDADESFSQIGADVVLDTRPDPVLPRNAVYARAAWDRIALPAIATGTRREIEVLQLMARGLQNKEIAARLFISAKTVDHHISALLYKLEAKSRVKAVQEAIKLGILK
jgi:DNA-binding NarL/FixJ family response regulator